MSAVSEPIVVANLARHRHRPSRSRDSFAHSLISHTTLTCSRRAHLVMYLIVCLALVVACIVYGIKVAQGGSTIIRWRGLIESIARGENVYNEWTKSGSFPYPPIAGLMLRPLTILPPVLSALVWFTLKVLMAAVAIRWSIRLAAGEKARFSMATMAALLILAGRPILSDLEHGNINILILFLVTGGLIAFRRGRDWLAGSLFGLATALKVTPILFVPYFAYKRQWRVVGWSLGGLCLFLLIVPGMILGNGRNWWLVWSWSGAMVEPYALEGKVETLQVNQSLAGVWFRLVTAVPGLECDGDEFAVNLLSLDTRIAFWAWKGIALAILAWVAWLSQGRVRDRGHCWLACQYSLVFIAMLLISERSWKHHYVTMLLPYCVLLAQVSLPLTEGGVVLGRGLRGFVIGSLVTAGLLMSATSTELGGWFAGGLGHKYAQAYWFFCASALVVFAAISVILSSAQRAASLTTGSAESAQV